MEKFSVKEHFEFEIEEIWNDESFQTIQFLDRGYAIQNELIKGSILFIGANPSFSKEKNLNPKSHFYENEQQGPIHPYFTKFQAISKEIEIPWSHLDLLHIRETDQKNIKRINKDLIGNGNKFFKKQLALSKKIITKIKPKIIVVSNAFARDLLDFHTDFDENLGTDRIINNPDLENTPIFFTSMLTGQRALDNGSYKRLIWHLKFVLNKIKTKT